MSERPFLELPLPPYQPEEAEYPRAKEVLPASEEEEEKFNERVIIIQL